MASSATTSVDESLWWDPFVLLFDDLENAPLPPTSVPLPLVSKLNRHRSWFLDSVSLFKPPNNRSKLALDSPQINVGSHQLTIKPEVKEAALKVSTCLCLDEVQSYLLMSRALAGSHLIVDCNVQEFLHLILVQYYIERQCLLKCIRHIIMLYLYVGDGSDENYAIRDEALQLVSHGLDRKLSSILQDLLSSNYPEHMELDLVTLWVEENLIEVNLILDILFLVYHESIFTCKIEQWKRLCALFMGIISNSSSIGSLAMSLEAGNSLYHVKVRLLLILIDTLDLGNLLRLVRDEVPFSQGHFIFSLADLQELDAIVSNLNPLETVGAGPLSMAWAVMVCLVSSLPEKGDCSPIMEIDHVAYVRQAFEAAALSYFLEILNNDILGDSDSPVAGYRSVIRTFISAFVASYEMSQQTEDTTFNQILDILCKTYRTEESLCMQFWDRDSFIDGPIRSIVCSLESEFPFQTVDFVRLLSALCEGTWPAECVYNFLDKMVGMTSLFEVSGDSFVDNTYQIVETHHVLHVPGVEGILIPGGTRGRVLKVFDENVCLIRWNYTLSGIYVLLLRLGQEFHLNGYEEVFVVLDLLCRMVSFNMALCFALMDIDNSLAVQAARMNGHIESNLCIDVVKIICTLATNMVPEISNVRVMSMCISILSKMLKCSPTHVASVALRANIFGLGTNGSSSGTWLLSGGLAQMLLIDCEQNEDCCSLTISVLDLTLQLVETGAENRMASALLVFSLQYVLVNHENWKYKLKHVRWQMTLKVLEVMRKCIKLIQDSQKLGCLIRDLLLYDSSIHNTLFRIMCVKMETLERIYVSRHFEVKEIEGLQLAVCSVLDIVFAMLSDFSKDFPSGPPTFHQAMLSSTTKPIPVVTALISLVSFFRNPAIQVAAARVFSMLCRTAENEQPYSFGDVCLAVDDIQVRSLNASICEIICEETVRNEDLFFAAFQILTSAACYQPALLLSIMSTKDNVAITENISSNVNDQPVEPPLFMPLQSKETNILDSLLQYVKRSEDLIEIHPRLLLNVLNFLKTLWEGTSQYMQILEKLKHSEKFWAYLSSFFLALSVKKPSFDNLEDYETLHFAYSCLCQSAVLKIMANEMFLQKRVSQLMIPEKGSSEASERRIVSTVSVEKAKSDILSELKDILATWCESSVVENLIKLFASSGYKKEVVLHAKLAVIICIVHVMEKLSTNDAGSLSISFVEKVDKIFKKLSEQPAFSELLAQYSVHRYSDRKELKTLILSDLYYHLEGELEGREITPGPFKDLSQYLLQLEIFQIPEHENVLDFCPPKDVIYLFDPICVRQYLGLDFWDHSGWKASKTIAERMLVHMHKVNLMTFLADSKHSALKALTALLSVHGWNLTGSKLTSIGGISKTPLESSIDCLCKCLQSTAESLIPSSYAYEDVLNFYASQAELLLNLVQVLYRQLSSGSNDQKCLPLCLLLIKTSASGLRVLGDIRPLTVSVKKTMKLFLTLFLTSIEFSYPKLHSLEKCDLDASDAIAEMSLVSLGLLPVLCNCVEIPEYCNLSLAAMDMLLKGFLTSETWLPVLQKHLQLPLILGKLQQKDSHVSISTILKFLLTLVRFRGGAEMLRTCNFFSSSLKVLLNLMSGDEPLPNMQDQSGFSSTTIKEENPHRLWGLTLAIVTAMINSLGEDSSSAVIIDVVIPYFFSEKAYLISYYLSAPEFPADGHNKKRARNRKSQTSLAALRETEFTLMLICKLAKHHRSWSKALKEMDSGLRETSIHFLAFISKGAQRVSESPNRSAPLLCPPILKEEIDFNSKQPFVDSKHGWFTLSAFGCTSKISSSAVPTTALSLPIKDQADGIRDAVTRTYFSDLIAIQIYKIAFLLLKFLCLEAKAAAKRAEEVGFIDLAHFPELPMPEILHGLQDQAVVIVTELCEINKSKSIDVEIQGLCVLLLQIMEKAMYLELCVSQICGIRPVLGRVEDFSREMKALIRVAQDHAFLSASLKSLKQITALLYPGLLQTEGIM